MYDLVIRSLAALELIIMINADQVTTSTVAASLCVLSLLEASALADARNEERSQILAWILFASSYIGVAGYLLLTNGDRSPYFPLLLTVLSFISSLLLLHLNHANEKMRQELHRTRDDSEELTEVLREQNRRLLNEQDQEVHLATLAERNRIAREIHDNVGHILSRGILLLGAIRTVSEDQTIAPQLQMLAETLDSAMAKMRESVHDLHDDSIDLRHNLEEIMAELTNFTIDTDLELENEIGREEKLAVIGITKEAVTNILRHSTGDRVKVILRQNPGFITLSISDNGSVSEKDRSRVQQGLSEGIGLANIRERARSCGGEAYFYMDDGFTVYVRLARK